MKLLIVEDSVMDRMLILAIIESLQHEIVVVEDGESAIKAFQEFRPELVLLDVLLPDMTGLEVAKKLRALEDDDWVPIVFLSSRVHADDIADGIMAGGDDYITKPIDEKIIRAKLIAMERITRMRHKILKISDKLKAANRELKKQVGLDGLTGIANRRHLDKQFEKELSGCERFDHPLSLILLDVDYFKKFNDEYGHLAGDDCLRLIAKTIDAQLPRKIDLAARYGGEEFALVLPGTCANDALLVAERVRSAILELRIPNKHSPFKCVTASLGIFGKTPNHGDVFEMYAERADKALYKAKNSGRNRSAVASWEQETTSAL
ncbi:MAG: diguanylate cyclase [Pseudomonadota bacterium]